MATDASPLIDLDDPELVEAMEAFALMSPEEAEEAFAEVIEMLGEDKDDPEMLEAIQEVMREMESMNSGADVKARLSSMTLEEEIAEATEMALEMISTSEWEVIYNKREDILDSVIASGKISAEDAALYKSDAAIWEEELKYIWDELQSQAKDSGKTKKAKSEEL